ncbi:MAG: hypothetical protein ISS93_01425 [Candidatus Aenigmarchaeota archaeon]|nr:hypothetical protein [Candidatus Aenigmarchaeota archaeon]
MKKILILVLAVVIAAFILLELFILSEAIVKLMDRFGGGSLGGFVQIGGGLVLMLFVMMYALRKARS